MSKDIRQISNSYLSFKIGGEVFAAHVAKVLNILEMMRITKVPRSPEYMLGVINLRGSVLPVIDMRIKFGIEDTSFTSNTCIIVMEIDIDGQTLQVGSVVDSVQEVLEMDATQIDAAPSIGNKYRADYLEGMGKVDEDFIMILDVDKVVSADELKELHELSKANKQTAAEAKEINEAKGKKKEKAE